MIDSSMLGPLGIRGWVERASCALRLTIAVVAIEVAATFLTPGVATAVRGFSWPSAGNALSCVVNSKISVKVIDEMDSDAHFFILVAFINDGDASCYFEGFPSAQPVIVSTPTAPKSRQLSFAGVRRARIYLQAHGGKSYVVYRITSTSDFAESRCEPIISDGVAFFIGERKRVARISQPAGATTVCRSFSSTAVGPYSHLPYG